MIKTRTIILSLALAALATTASAQVFTGEHKYDGEHKNELSGYFMGGNNVVVQGYGGLAASYKYHLTDRWTVGGDAQAQLGKQLYSVDAKGGYRLPFKFLDFYFDATLLYNRYERWKANEKIANLSVTVESPYLYLRVGESYIRWSIRDFGYTEPLTLTFGFGAQMRPRWNSWNVGIFFRNYDDFYFENWNINWGLNFYGRINSTMNFFGEFNIRPAGSMSQLASKYETSGKLGIKYVW
ncbi:hypothetical protein [Xylanibacter ruminicola]|jgi:hypothetical protein|uniref:Outer membrane protein beta-barrel domain-containing protein n=1 Tax=Xylanibacter ruminicola TaxID=839 RepID=A0A1M6TXF2_XYLRU|nr:hypothetical protein [Xylanibacter ruminicola]SHK61573.1 hypothetical protein SAMN05216463_10768 [Xylanibacter ruminicola]